MARQVLTVNTATDTFQIFVDKTNEVIEIVNTYVITANNGTPDVTSGNAFVNGYFGSNNLLVQTVSGGDFTASGNLVITTNVSVNSTSSITVGNSIVNSTTFYIESNTIFSVNSSILSIGNSSVNVSTNSTLLRFANSSSSANISLTSFAIGTSVVNGSVITTGSSGLIANTSALSVGANVIVNTSSIFVGNSTVNTVLSSTISVANSTGSANVNPIEFKVGLSTVNSTTVSVGSNLVINSSSLLVGNSTVNSVANSSALRLANSTSNISISVPTSAQVSNGFFFLNANSTWSVVPTPQTLETNTIVLEHSQHTTNTFTTTGTSQQTVDQFATATFRSAEYLVSVKDNNADGYQTSKMIMVHDGTTALVTEYSVLVTHASLGVFAADISGANVRLLFTPVSSNTTVKFIRELIEV